jgi:hypothetical protein
VSWPHWARRQETRAAREATVKVPEKLLLTVLADGRPLAEMLVKLEFPMSAKNPHHMVFGPSDSAGQISIAGDQMRTEAKNTQALFLKDYDQLEAGWTGKLKVRPMNLSMIKRALAAYRIFGSHQYAAGYENHLQAAKTALAQMPQAVLTVKIVSDVPASVSVVAGSVRAGK